MYCAVVVQEVLQRRWESWRWGISGWLLDVDNDQLRAITEADPLSIIWEIVEEVNVNHSMVIWHLKQIGKVKNLGKWMPHELTENKKNRFEMLSSLILCNNKEPFLDQTVMCDESGFYMTTNQLVVGLRRNFKALPKAKLAPKESRSLFGGQLLVWSTIAFWILAKPLHLRCVLSKLMRCTENCNACSQHWSTERAQFFLQQCPTTRHTTKASKVEWIGLWSFASLPYSPDLSPINHHFFKHLDNFLQGKCFHNQQDAENAFQGFTESWSLNFYATGKKTNFVGKNVLIVMVPILINKNVFEPSHIDLKFMVQNHSYFCTHIE